MRMVAMRRLNTLTGRGIKDRGELRGESAMYAWRARIGLIKPTHRGKSFHFWYDRAPDGVEIVPTFVGFRRSDRQTFEKAFERIEQIADDLKAVGCQLISTLRHAAGAAQGPRLRARMAGPAVAEDRAASDLADGAARARACCARRQARRDRHLLRRRAQQRDQALLRPLRYRGRGDRRTERARPSRTRSTRPR